MSWTQDDLNAIEAAIATGARKVKYGDKEVEYDSFNDLKAIKSLIEQSLANKPRKSRRYGVYFKT